MKEFNIDDIVSEKVIIKSEKIPAGIKVLFNGEIDVQNPDAVFLPYFDEIHDKMLENEIKDIELDFTNLTFMNSGGIKTLVKWITKVLVLPKNKKYKFRIIANSKISWQEASLQMLSRLSPGLIEIMVK
ncbi:MAG: hypothetical protein KAT05_08270 [Spirochaetes bacterium]|nr:hypothetical protein [Spirochaetota bacterium]